MERLGGWPARDYEIFEITQIPEFEKYLELEIIRICDMLVPNICFYPTSSTNLICDMDGFMKRGEGIPKGVYLTMAL